MRWVGIAGYWAVAACVVVAGASHEARAACAEELAAGNLAGCLGAGAEFEIVADKAKLVSPMRVRRVNAGNGNHYTYREISSWETGSVCALSASFTGRVEQPSRAGGDIAAMAPGPKPAARFKTGRSRGYGGCGIEIAGDIRTSGAAPTGIDDQDYCLDGAIDASGKVQTCSEALAGRSAVSSQLVQLPTTTPLGTNGVYLVKGDAPQRLEAGAGVHVFTAKKILLKPGRECYGGGGNRSRASTGRRRGNGGPRCYKVGAVLEIAFGAETKAVVINTEKLQLGQESQIFVDGDPSKVIVNVTGKGSVPIGRYSDAGIAILAPQASIRVDKESVTGSLLAKSVSLKGASTTPGGGGGGDSPFCCQRGTPEEPTCQDASSERQLVRCEKTGGFADVAGGCDEASGYCPSFQQQATCCQWPECLPVPPEDCGNFPGFFDDAGCCRTSAGCTDNNAEAELCGLFGGVVGGSSCNVSGVCE